MEKKNTPQETARESEEKMIYHDLVRVSRKLLEPSVREFLPVELWEEAFEACASGPEWEEFCRQRQQAPEWPFVQNLWEHSRQPFCKPKKSVSLAPLDTCGLLH
ncbi:MAG: hypothetical protein HKM05_02360 [Spirochaetales bacterium]|nr:hypothetical protein [Spirochaetales bacterium]